TRPGLCTVATRGPARYFGGEEALARRVVAAVATVVAGTGAHVGAGVADGAFAAALAARATPGLGGGPAGGAGALLGPGAGARPLAAELHARLEGGGLACTRLVIEARTTDGEDLSRVWRHEGRFTPGATAERVRWQLDGWLLAGGPRPEGGGLVRLRLVPDE